MGLNLQNWNCPVIFLTGDEPLPTFTILQNSPISIGSCKRVSFMLLHAQKPAPVSSSTRSPPLPFCPNVTGSCRTVFLWTYLLTRTSFVRRPARSRLYNVIALLFMARRRRTISLQFSRVPTPLSYTVDCGVRGLPSQPSYVSSCARRLVCVTSITQRGMRISLHQVFH